jgi:hypothetical protein
MTNTSIGAYIFVYLIWRTVDGPAALRARRPAKGRAAIVLPIA